MNIFAGLMTVLVLMACTTHYTVNSNITTVKSVERYSLRNQAESQKSDELLLILTFSGGGTRAAALSYGVLQTLADTQVAVGGKQLRLLDEVDVISSVSGGSFTSAKTYLIEVSLDQTADESERQHLLSLPTSFYLEPKDVDRLKAAARELLSASAEFQRLVSDLQ